MATTIDQFRYELYDARNSFNILYVRKKIIGNIVSKDKRNFVLIDFLTEILDQFLNVKESSISDQVLNDQNFITENEFQKALNLFNLVCNSDVDLDLNSV